MTSIYQHALREKFDQLHPRIRERFGFCSQDGIACIGRGVMDRVWHAGPWVKPWLLLGAHRNILVPDAGTNVPFTVENYAFRDSQQRETVTWVRTFAFPTRARRFDATMLFSRERNRIVDYLGTHQHLAVDIDLAVERNGGLRLRAGSQRFYERPLAFKFPMLFSGMADVCEWFDDAIGKFRIRVDVRHRLLGSLFGYEGTFDVEFRRCSATPAHVVPLRTEARE